MNSRGPASQLAVKLGGDAADLEGQMTECQVLISTGKGVKEATGSANQMDNWIGTEGGKLNF